MVVLQELRRVSSRGQWHRLSVQKLDVNTLMTAQTNKALYNVQYCNTIAKENLLAKEE
jgi:hypothetical protein